MTTTIVFSAASDGYLVSENASYATALAGPADTAVGTKLSFGQTHTGAEYHVSQSGLDFDGSAVSADLLAVAGYVRLRNTQAFGTSVSRNAELREYDWGVAFESADFRDPNGLTASPLECTISSINDASAFQYVRFGQETGVNPGNSYVVNSSRNRLQNTPTGAEYNDMYSSEASGTASDPALYYTTVPESNLCGILGAQVQLSDGTHAYLQLDAPDNAFGNLHLIHRDAAGNTTDVHELVAVDPAGGTGQFKHPETVAAQAMTLVVDSLDNLYVIGPENDTSDNILAQAFTKGVGYSWTAGTRRSTAMPAHDGKVNNIAATWHNEGTGGTIVAVIGRDAARNTGTETAYALLNCNYLLTGSGSLLRASGSTSEVLVEIGSNGFNNFTNPTGTLLDVVAAPGVTNRGFVLCSTRDDELGGDLGVSVARYQLASGGASFVDTDRYANAQTNTKDASAKSRVIGISTSQFVVVNANDSSGRGIQVQHFQNIGTSGTFTALASVELADESITSMPSPSTLATSQLWDAIYDPDSNQVWIYYFDTADEHRLMRTHVDLNTGQAAADEVEVDDAVGVALSTNHAIRVHRGPLNGDQVLISVANETSGGVHSTIYVTDTLNVAPTAPTLVEEPNFDGDDAATFQWTFNDPNSGDTQSAYQLQINTSAGVSEVDTTKTVSGTSSHALAGGTLSNPGDWQWRVKTWDAADAEGAWSDFSTFSTAAGGTVTITDPASDNPAGVNVDSYLIEWSVAGATQDDYRVTMTRTDTEVEVLDTDWVNSSDTTFEVTGMLSDVEYRIEVTARDASDIETNTDSVLITPDYDSPQTPTVGVSVNSDDGYILVTVTNPEPEGDEPNADHNDILRRVFNELTDEAYIKIGECEENGSFRDYTAASGVTYEYVARAQSDPS